jgi:hypothetical protein
LYPHRIRLRDPWTREPRDGGGLRLRRGFHRPTINVGERVWIVCEGLKSVAVASLDGSPLTSMSKADEPWSCDVTERLVDRHELTFDFAALPPGDELPWREVRLEVRLP